MSLLQSGGALGRHVQSAEGQGARGGGDTHLEVPVRRDPQPVAGPAEMLRHRRDEADLASETGDFKGLWAGAEEMGVGRLSLTSDLTPFPLCGSPEESRLQGPQTTETLSSLPAPGLPKMKAPKVSGSWGQHGQRQPRGRARQAPVHHLPRCVPQQAP